MPEDLSVQTARVRAALPSRPSHVDAKEVERVAFDVSGHRDLGLRVWTDAREAAEQAWRTCRTRMRARHGARSPHGGWLMFVLFAAILTAAFSAALASGFRSDPEETAGALTVLVILAVLLDVFALAVAGWRPLNWAAIRMQIGVAIALTVAAVFELSPPATAATPFVVAAAGVGIVGLVLVFIVRAARPQERAEIDNAVNVAVQEMQPEVDAIGQRLQAEVIASLSAEDAAHIVALRERTIAQLSEGGHVFSEHPETAPAGGVIIASVLATWNPYAAKGR